MFVATLKSTSKFDVTWLSRFCAARPPANRQQRQRPENKAVRLWDLAAFSFQSRRSTPQFATQSQRGRCEGGKLKNMWVIGCVGNALIKCQGAICQLCRCHSRILNTIASATFLPINLPFIKPLFSARLFIEWRTRD